MFRCDFCKQVTQPKEPCTKVVTETRQVDYKIDGKVVGHGQEIAKEKNACPKCYDEQQELLDKIFSEKD